MSEVKTENENPEHSPAYGVAAELAKPPKSRAAAKEPASSSEPVYYTVEAAAAKLSLDPAALRARLRRAQRTEGNTVVADLGGGIHGFKFGKSWRIRFPGA